MYWIKIYLCPYDQLMNLNVITSFRLWISKVTFFTIDIRGEYATVPISLFPPVFSLVPFYYQ